MSNKLGEFIREKRKEAKMTLKQLGNEAGVSYPYISTLETGKRGNPSAEVLNKIAAVLGISSVEMLTVAGYLAEEKNDEFSYMEYEKVKLNQINPMELLEMLEPDVLSNIFLSYIKKTDSVVDDYLLKVLQEGAKGGVTSKEIIDMVVINHKELLHVFVFMASIANYNRNDISHDSIWGYMSKLQDISGVIEDAFDFDAFQLWYKYYFDDEVLADYGDFELRNSRDFTFDLSPILENDTVLLNGGIINRKTLKSIRALLTD